jgi:methyl-accepting chemotaxis protein
MDGVTQQNAAMVEQATAASRSLAAEADGLARQMGRFKLDDQGVSSAQPVNVVHRLQARAGGSRAAARPVTRGNTALAVAAEDDWSEF